MHLSRAVTYARVSTEGQAESGYSLGDQERALAAFCQAREYQLVEHVADEGVSGRMDDRPGLQRVRELHDAGAVDVLLLVKINRLSRKAWKGLQILEEMQRRGLRVEFVEHSSGHTPADRLQVGVLGVVAEYEWETLRLTMMGGRVEKIAKKEVMPCGFGPYGYKQISRAEAQVIPEYFGRDGQVEVIEEEAIHVREVFRRYLAGDSIMSLARYLNEQGEKTRRGNIWRQGAIQRLLQQPAYAGYRVYGRATHRNLDEKTESGKARVKITPNDPDLWHRIPCPAIVEVGTWERANAKLKHSADLQRGRPTYAFPLQGLIVCAHCTTGKGTPLRCGGGRNGKDPNRRAYSSRYYQCASHARLELTYCGAYISAKRLEDKVLEILERELSPGVIGAAARAHAEAEMNRDATAAEEMEHLERELAMLDLEEGRIADLLLKGISGPVVDSRLRPVQEKRILLNARLATARRRRAFVVDPLEVERRAEEWATRAREQLKLAKDDLAIFKALAKQLIRITLYAGAPPTIEVVISNSPWLNEGK